MCEKRSPSVVILSNLAYDVVTFLTIFIHEFGKLKANWDDTKFG